MEIEYSSGFLTKGWRRSRFNAKLNLFKQTLEPLEQSYAVYKLQTNFSNHEPLYRSISLLLGIISVVFSSLLFIQM